MPEMQMQEAIEETVFHIVPTEVQFKGRVRLEGDFLIGEIWVQYAALPPRKVTARVNMREILQQFAAAAPPANDAEISGLFDFVKKGISKLSDAAKSVGRAKLIKGLSRGVKSVIRHPATGAITQAAAVVFPPVGVPAAAAYQGANAALAALDKKGPILSKLQAFYGRAIPGALSMVPGMPPGVSQAVSSFVKDGKVSPALMQAADSIVGPGAAAALQQAGNATSMIKNLGQRARQGDPRAAMQAQILRRVNAARQRIEAQKAQLVALRQTPVPRPGLPPFIPRAMPGIPPFIPRAMPGLPPFASTQPVSPRLPVQPFRF